MRLRSHLILLVVAAILPLLIFSGFVVYQELDQQREILHRGMRNTARALSLSLDGEVRAFRSILETLAASRALAADDYQNFHAESTEALVSHKGAYIVLFDKTGQQLVNTRLPHGTVLPNPLTQSKPATGKTLYPLLPLGGDAIVKEVLDSARPAVSDLFVALSTGRPTIGIGIPVIREGAARYVLQVAVEPEPFLQLLLAHRLPEDSVASLLDRNGVIMARTVNPTERLGQRLPTELADQVAGSDEGIGGGRTREGLEIVHVFTRSRATGWKVSLGVSEKVIGAPIFHSVLLVGGGTIAAVLLGMVVAIGLGRRIARPISVLGHSAGAIARGERTELNVAPVYELNELYRALVNAGDSVRRAAEERERSVVNHVVDGIITIDERGSVESFNPAAEQLFGFTAGEVVGQNVNMLMPEPYRREHDNYLANYLRTGQAKIIGVGREVTGRRKDGSTFPMDLAVSEFRAGSKRLFTGIVRDITERKRAEEALRESRERLSAEAKALSRLNELSSRLWRAPTLGDGLEEMLTATIDLMGADMGNIQMLDAGFLRIAAQRGFKHDFLESLREVPAGDDSACGRALRTGERIVIEDVETSAPHARLREIARSAGYRAVQTTPIVARSGTPLGMISTHWRSVHHPDQHDLGRLDLYVRQAADFIERQAAEMALKEADRQKDEFLARLGHELRNPLAALTAAAHVLRARNPDGASAQAQGVIERQTSHMTRLAEDMLEITRIRMGKISLKRELLNLAELASDGIESIRVAGGFTSRAQLDRDAAPAWVYGDRARIAQIISNLLDNALKFTPATGSISVGVRHEGDWTVLRVSDTGRGIAPDALSAMFLPFVQGPDNAQRGLGIGLALVRQLAELHGGSVVAHSDGIDKGSTFVVRFPAASPPEMPAAAPVKGPPPGVSRRILVVEDNVDAREMLSSALAILGHEVSAAGDGDAAIAAAASARWDAAVIDIGLPGMDGYELARRLRASFGSASMTLIALSGFGQDHDDGRSREAGFDVHLVKPAAAERISQLIAQLSPRDGGMLA